MARETSSTSIQELRVDIKGRREPGSTITNYEKPNGYLFLSSA